MGRLSACRCAPSLPLLDRLIDEAPEKAQDTPISPSEAMSILRRSVRRDIEALLNSRRRWRSWQATFKEFRFPPELRHSGLHRGQVPRRRRTGCAAPRDRGHDPPVRAAFPFGACPG